MLKFYTNKSGNIIAFVNKTEEAVVSAGEEFVEIKANSTDAAGEKHVPVVKVNGNKVRVEVGSVFHPMLEEHSITFIAIETKEGNQMKKLTPGQEPVAEFALADGDALIAAYEYCNLHGLWKTEA